MSDVTSVRTPKVEGVWRHVHSLGDWLILALLCLSTVLAVGLLTSAPLGALATTLGRFDDAERHFEDAIAMNRKMRAPRWVAVAQCNYGDMLLRRAKKAG